MTIKFQDKTAADKKEIGFHYQHYYALLQLLKINPDESLSVEEKDDVVIFTSQGTRLIQLKHTLQLKKGGTPKNLASKDYALWHTIDNWIKLIADKADNREEATEQIKFIETTIFSLVTNKSNGNDNVFLNNLEKFKTGEIKIDKFKEEIKKLIVEPKDKKSDDEIISDKYINAFLNFEHLDVFLYKIQVALGEDNLINQIKEYIKISLAVTNYEDAYYEIEGRLRTLNYLTIKNNKKVTYTKQDFSKKVLTPVMEKIRNSKFHVTKEKYIQNLKLENEVFAKQLLDISVSLEDVIEYSYSMQLCLANLKKWEERDNIIFSNDRDAYFKSAMKIWKHLHGTRHRQSSSEENNSLDCFSDCMLEDLNLCSIPMEQEISNGTFIYLSDDLKIGWLNGWKTKYEKK